MGKQENADLKVGATKRELAAAFFSHAFPSRRGKQVFSKRKRQQHRVSFFRRHSRHPLFDRRREQRAGNDANDAPDGGLAAPIASPCRGFYRGTRVFPLRFETCSSCTGSGPLTYSNCQPPPGKGPCSLTMPTLKTASGGRIYDSATSAGFISAMTFLYLLTVSLYLSTANQRPNRR